MIIKELVWPYRNNRNVMMKKKKVRCLKRADVSEGRRRQQGFEFDPELRSVLELATDSELSEIQTILFGPRCFFFFLIIIVIISVSCYWLSKYLSIISYLSPLLKSITSASSNMDPSMIEHDIQLRQHFIETLESRFFFLAADARSTLRGWRPSYRNVLLHLTSKLNIPCSTQLHTHHLELEIFLHLLHFNSHVSASSHTQWKHFQSILFKVLTNSHSLFISVSFQFSILTHLFFPSPGRWYIYVGKDISIGNTVYSSFIYSI